MVVAISALAVMSSGASETTVISSESWPSWSVTGTSIFWLALSVNPLRMKRLNPDSSTVNVYSPTASAGMKNRPPASVTRSSLAPTAPLATTTLAPGSRPPCSSRTDPEISAVLYCEKPARALSRMMQNASNASPRERRRTSRGMARTGLDRATKAAGQLPMSICALLLRRKYRAGKRVPGRLQGDETI